MHVSCAMSGRTSAFISILRDFGCLAGSPRDTRSGRAGDGIGARVGSFGSRWLGGGARSTLFALSWPRDEARARTAYLLSATTLEYLVVEGGPRALEVLLRRWKELGELRAGVSRHVLGPRPPSSRRSGGGYVEERYGWLFVLSHSAVFLDVDELGARRHGRGPEGGTAGTDGSPQSGGHPGSAQLLAKPRWFARR